MRYFRVLIISLAIHLGLAVLLWLTPPARFDVKQPVYVDLLEKPELAKRPHQEPRNEKEFVRHLDVPDKLLTTKKKEARFASDEERTVLEEQKARANDLTANRSLDGKNQAHDQKARRQASRRSMDFSPTSPLDRAKEDLLEGDPRSKNGDLRVGGITKRAPRMDESGEEGGAGASPSFGGLERGYSTLGEAVPDDVKFGDFTALNTDRQLFYTFYARMEEKIRYRWVTYARAAVFSLPIDPKKRTGKDTFITKLEVILDREGHFMRAILHESSGIHSLDQAPVQAFRDAGQFPNPPQEMVKDDGVIHIYYAFNVNMVPPHLADKGD